MYFSDIVSSAAVGSSRIIIGLSNKNALAREIRFFSPPDNFTHLSPITVSIPLILLFIKSRQPAALAAFSISLSEAFGFT